MKMGTKLSLSHRTFGPLAQSLAMIMKRPVIVLAVIAGGILLFAIGRVTGQQQEGAAELAKAFAPAPLDVYADLGIADSSILGWRMPALFVFRVLLVSLVLSLFLQTELNARRIGKVAGLYVICFISTLIPLGISLAFLNSVGDADSAIEGLTVFATLLATPIVLSILVVTLSPLMALAIDGSRVRPMFRDPSIWLSSVVATWLYLLTSQRIEEAQQLAPASPLPYLSALIVLLMETILVGAIALSATRSADDYFESELPGSPS